MGQRTNNVILWDRKCPRVFKLQQILFNTKLSQKILNYDVNKIEYSEHI